MPFVVVSEEVYYELKQRVSLWISYDDVIRQLLRYELNVDMLLAVIERAVDELDGGS